MREDKIHRLIFKHRIKIIVVSFIAALIIFLISLFTKNEGGVYMIVFYPLSLGAFLLDLYIDWSGKTVYRYLAPLLMLVLAVVAFILGFFTEF